MSKLLDLEKQTEHNGHWREAAAVQFVLEEGIIKKCHCKNYWNWICDRNFRA